MTLKIGTLEIQEVAGHSWRQRYSEIGTGLPFRTRNGGLIAHQRYRKLQSSISGEGWDVAGLEGLNPATAYALHCIKPRSLSSASNVITIPHSYSQQLAALCMPHEEAAIQQIAAVVAAAGSFDEAIAGIEALNLDSKAWAGSLQLGMAAAHLAGRGDIYPTGHKGGTK